MDVRMGIKTGKWQTEARWIKQKMMRDADFYKINISVQKLYATVSCSSMYFSFPAKDLFWCLFYN